MIKIQNKKKKITNFQEKMLYIYIYLLTLQSHECLVWLQLKQSLTSTDVSFPAPSFRVAVKSRLKFLFEGFWVLWEHFTLAVYKQPWKYRNMHGRQAIFSHLLALWGLLHGLVSLVSKSFANRRTLLLDESSIIHQKPSTPRTIGQWHHQAIDRLLRGPCHRITWFRGQWLIFSVRATFNVNQ